MRITVQFFSYFRPIAGADRMAFEVAEGISVAELLSLLGEKLGNSTFTEEPVLMMVNRRNSPPAAVLKEGDEVLLLPVIGGG